MKMRWFSAIVLLSLLMPAGVAYGASLPQNPPAEATVVSPAWEVVIPTAWTRFWRSPAYDLNRTVYAIADDELRVSTDDGDSWQPLYRADGELRALAFDPTAAWDPTLFVAGAASDSTGYVQRSTDGGLSWQTVLTDTEKPFRDVAAVRGATGALVVFAAGEDHLWRSADGGDSWTPLHAALPEFASLDHLFPSPDFAADGTVYLTGFNPPLRSTDGGLTWQQISIPGVDIPREVSFSPNYAADGTLWVSYFWIEGSGEEDLPMNGIVRSTDRGLTWQKAREGLPVDWPDGWILGLAVSPEYAADQALFTVERVATGEGTAHEFYRSHDRGSTWELQGLTPNATPHGLVAVRRDLLFLPTEHGLYRLRTPCWEWLRNGNCEQTTAWEFPATPITAAYTLEQAHSPSRSLRVGLTTAANWLGYSSARQRISLPSTLMTATLSAWLYPLSTEVQLAQLDAGVQRLPSAMAGDAQYVLLLDDQGLILERLLWTRSNSRQWSHYSFDLSAYIGRSFWLLFGVYNDGSGGKTGMYVDDVSLSGCQTPSAPPELPAPQTHSVPQDFLLSDAAGPQRSPALAYNAGDDEYLAVWTSVREAATSDIVAQRLSRDGRLLGPAVTLTVSPTLQAQPAVAYLAGAERYLVVWEERSAVDGLADIYGRWVTRAGLPDGDVFPIVAAEGAQSGPQVAAAADTALVVWTDAQPLPARVRGRQVNGAGTLGVAILDISDGAGVAAFPAVAFSPALSEFVVAWEDRRGEAHETIYAQRVTAAGELDGDNVAVSAAAGAQRRVAVAANSTHGRVLFVWNDWRLATPQLYGRELDFSVDLLQPPEFRISTEVIAEGAPALAFWPDANGYLVIWQAPTGEGDLLARRVLSGGLPWGLPVSVSDDPRAQTSPALAVATASDPDTAVVVWQDARAGANTGIYGQRLQHNGGRLGLHFGLTGLPRLQTRPALAYSRTSDRFLASWANVFGGGGNQSTAVQAYLLEGDGSLASAPITLTEHVLTETTGVSVAWDSWGDDEFLAVWSAAEGIVGQRVAADGSLSGANFVVAALPATLRAPFVVAGSNVYLVVFEATEPLSGTTDIYGQLLMHDGALLGDEVNISRLEVAGQQALNPHAAYDAVNNVFFVVWQEQDPASPDVPRWDIAGQALAGEDGSLLGSRQLLTHTPTLQESQPRIAWAGPEERAFYLVVWAAFDTETGQSEIMARRLEESGVPVGDATPLTATATEQEGRPALGYDPFEQRFLVVWDITAQGGSAASAIQGRWLDPAGLPVEELLSFAEASDSARNSPVVAARPGRGSWLVAWEDGRVDTALEHLNIYARRIASQRRVFLPLVLKLKQ
ncbi:MAG: exo-alpha-sialidase [Anaerolineae bacterium]|nr:exo-alpha-sialidase [Anaerolineae bacterium]